MKRSFLSVAESQVYEHILKCFLQIKKITFENLPVAKIKVYEHTVEAFFMQIKN
jgi:hypothetical protein